MQQLHKASLKRQPENAAIEGLIESHELAFRMQDAPPQVMDLAGETDEFGYKSVIDPVHIHDWHATILHLLGLQHTKLTFRHAGRDMRLTEVNRNVMKGIFG